jgi:hypothetical protein
MSESPGPLDEGQKGACQFCGLSAASWQAPFCYEGDAGPNVETRGIPCCVLCHLALSLDRETIDAEGVLIWCPQLSQAVVNCLVRSIHRRLTLKGVPFDPSRRPGRGDIDGVAAANILADLQFQSERVEKKIGSAQPSALVRALVEMKRRGDGLGPGLISGLRLLPLGRFFRNGTDIYPELIASLTAPDAKGTQNAG